MNHRALTSVGFFAVLAACSVNGCTKTDSANDDAAGGTPSGGTAAGGDSGASTAGSAGHGTAGATGIAGSSVGGTGAGTAGNGTGGSEAGMTGLGEAGAPSGGTGGGGSGGSAGGATCPTANTQTDANNCGRCGKVCESGDCEGGECTPVVVLFPKLPEIHQTTVVSPTTLLSGGNVYEWEKTDDALLTPELRFRFLRASSTPATPASQGTIVDDIADAAPFTTAVAFDATSFYQCSSAGVTKVALSAAGATPTAFFKAPTIAGGFECGAITITATAAYLTNRDVGTGKQTFYSIPLPPASATTAPTLIPTLGPRDTPVSELTVVGTKLFWLENDLAGSSQPRLMTAPVTGGTPTMVDSDLGANGGAAIVSDGTYLYWTDNTGNVGQVRRAPLATLVPATAPVAQAVDAFKGLLVSGAYVYFMEGQSREVFRAPKDGSGDKEGLGMAFVTDDSDVQHLGLAITGVDASFVYFLLDDGLIARLPNVP